VTNRWGAGSALEALLAFELHDPRVGERPDRGHDDIGLDGLGAVGVSLSSTQTLRPSSNVALFRSRLNSVWSWTPYLREMWSR